MTTIDITLTSNDFKSTIDTITISNFPKENLNRLSYDGLKELFEYKYYLNTPYDYITLIEIEFLLLRIGKKTVLMMCVPKK